MIKYQFDSFSEQMYKTIVISRACRYMPGNVVRGNQNYANEILMGASAHELQSIDRMSPNLLSLYLQISKRKNWQFGNVVPNSFHFYTRLITKLHGKTNCQLLIIFLV